MTARMTMRRESKRVVRVTEDSFSPDMVVEDIRTGIVYRLEGKHESYFTARVVHPVQERPQVATFGYGRAFAQPLEGKVERLSQSVLTFR